MIISQAYKPLHAKSTQYNKNTIAVTKGMISMHVICFSHLVALERQDELLTDRSPC